MSDTATTPAGAHPWGNPEDDTQILRDELDHCRLEIARLRTRSTAAGRLAENLAHLLVAEQVSPVEIREAAGDDLELLIQIDAELVL